MHEHRQIGSDDDPYITHEADTVECVQVSETRFIPLSEFLEGHGGQSVAFDNIKRGYAVVVGTDNLVYKTFLRRVKGNMLFGNASNRSERSESWHRTYVKEIYQ